MHLAGHACFRLLQFLSAPNVLHDLHGLEDAIGAHSTAHRSRLSALRSDGTRRGLFLIALERGFLDNMLDRLVVEPFTRFAVLLTQLDAWLCLPRLGGAAAAAAGDAVLGAGLPSAADGGDQDE